MDMEKSHLKPWNERINRLVSKILLCAAQKLMGCNNKALIFLGSSLH